ncbi:hypothetical protein [Mycolicibacterium sp. J2]|uniref:hypothetical protein n=1 Tax=Mycolicibacterium sp. J2 TaxID=2993511 RepID=UPI00224A54E8|nr:hypothetical protein [Mycolicibacterium sp. J2]MCX2716102.1 hypothetical protein [Mycolicibacterium sp. J2]
MGNEQSDENKPSTLEKIGVTTAVGIGAEVAGFYAGVPGLSAGTTALVMGMYEMRRHRLGEFFRLVIHKLGGEDKLAEAVENDPEREQILYDAAQAAIATTMNEKRMYLADVAAAAMTGDKQVVDKAALIVAALSELDAVHISALTHIAIADDAYRANPGASDEPFQSVVRAEHPPVLAALVRTGVVLVGSQEVRPGMYSIPRADTYSITGVNGFGRDLLEELGVAKLDHHH